MLFGLALLLCAFPCAAQESAAPPTSRQRALLFEERGDDAGAESAWRDWLKAHPSSAEAYANLGVIAARQQHYTQAIADDRKALALHFPGSGLRLNLGLALFKDGQMQQAAQEFLPLIRVAAANSPERQRLAILLGMSYYGAGEYAKAAPFLQEAADRDPSNLPLRLALAHSYLWTRQDQKVLAVYREILVLNPNSAEADMLAGEALDQMKDWTGAVDQFRAAIQADPTLPDVHFGLGYLYWSKHRYPEAIPEFTAELKLDPNDAEDLSYLGDCHVKLSQFATARPILEKAIHIDPKDELAHLDLGAIDASTGQSKDALHELKLAESLAPNDVNVHWRLGRLYRAMGQTAEAKVEFDKTKNIVQAADTALVEKLSPREQKSVPAVK
ncbi:MAG: tetratricopeptide repeat protein [Acidobacteriaceae bacterium]